MAIQPPPQIIRTQWPLRRLVAQCACAEESEANSCNEPLGPESGQHQTQQCQRERNPAEVPGKQLSRPDAGRNTESRNEQRTTHGALSCIEPFPGEPEGNFRQTNRMPQPGRLQRHQSPANAKPNAAPAPSIITSQGVPTRVGTKV